MEFQNTHYDIEDISAKLVFERQVPDGDRPCREGNTIKAFKTESEHTKNTFKIHHCKVTITLSAGTPG